MSTTTPHAALGVHGDATDSSVQVAPLSVLLQTSLRKARSVRPANSSSVVVSPNAMAENLSRGSQGAFLTSCVHVTPSSLLLQTSFSNLVVPDPPITTRCLDPSATKPNELRTRHSAAAVCRVHAKPKSLLIHTSLTRPAAVTPPATTSVEPAVSFSIATGYSVRPAQLLVPSWIDSHVSPTSVLRQT